MGPPLFTAMSYRAPAASAGLVAPMRVELVTAALAPTPPMVTDAPGANWLPTRWIDVPPEAGPEVP